MRAVAARRTPSRQRIALVGLSLVVAGCLVAATPGLVANWRAIRYVARCLGVPVTRLRPLLRLGWFDHPIELAEPGGEPAQRVFIADGGIVAWGFRSAAFQQQFRHATPLNRAEVEAAAGRLLRELLWLEAAAYQVTRVERHERASARARHGRLSADAQPVWLVLIVLSPPHPFLGRRLQLTMADDGRPRHLVALP